MIEAKWVRERLADPVHCGQGLRYLEHLNVVWRKSRRSKSWEVWTNFPEDVRENSICKELVAVGSQI
jgi:hypothetical protein